MRDGLIGQEAFSQAFEIFAADPKIGIIAPEEAFLPAKKIEYMLGSLPHIKQIMTRAGFSEYELQDFPAGTMFWFRFDAFKAINALNYVSDDFEPELGQVDATLAHAFERAFTTLVVAQNYKIGKYCCISAASPYYGRDSV